MARRSRNRSRDTAKFVVSGALVFAIAAVIIAGTIYFGRSGPEALDARLCPKSGPRGQVVLLVDKTDPLNFTQKAAFSSRLQELVERGVPTGHLLTVFTLDDDFRETATPVAAFCNPGAEEGHSEWTANLKHLRERYETAFRGPLLKLADDLVGSKSANHSPIFEMLQLAGINAFQREHVSGPKRLIVFSDMLHNTPQYSMFRGQSDFATFIATDYGRKALANLEGVDVELHYIMLAPRLQTRANAKFWEDYFQKAGARVVAVRPLEG